MQVMKCSLWLVLVYQNLYRRTNYTIDFRLTIRRMHSRYIPSRLNQIALLTTPGQDFSQFWDWSSWTTIPSESPEDIYSKHCFEWQSYVTSSASFGPHGSGCRSSVTSGHHWHKTMMNVHQKSQRAISWLPILRLISISSVCLDFHEFKQKKQHIGSSPNCTSQSKYWHSIRSSKLSTTKHIT